MKYGNKEKVQKLIKQIEEAEEKLKDINRSKGLSLNNEHGFPLFSIGLLRTEGLVEVDLAKDYRKKLAEYYEEKIKDLIDKLIDL